MTSSWICQSFPACPHLGQPPACFPRSCSFPCFQPCSNAQSSESSLLLRVRLFISASSKKSSLTLLAHTDLSFGSMIPSGPCWVHHNQKQVRDVFAETPCKLLAKHVVTWASWESAMLLLCSVKHACLGMGGESQAQGGGCLPWVSSQISVIVRLFYSP